MASRYRNVSLPVQNSASDLWKRLSESVSKNAFDTSIYRFNVPELRVGTLDSLLSLSDDLLKVPRSSKKLHEDNEYALYTVTLFRKMADNFKIAAREKGFQMIRRDIDRIGQGWRDRFLKVAIFSLLSELGLPCNRETQNIFGPGSISVDRFHSLTALWAPNLCFTK